MGIGGRTRLVGLIGWPVSHSLSPAMHNAAAAALGLDWVYLPLPVRPVLLEAAIRGLIALGFAGVNVTVPHKENVLPFLDHIEPAANAVGAVNTIVIERDGESTQLSGFNTDVAGFLRDLGQQGVEVSGRDCLVLGAGGSARAVAYGLALHGGRVQVLARRGEQAQQLARDLDPHLAKLYTPGGSPLTPLRTHGLHALQRISQESAAPLIVNSTPVGMAPDIDASVWPDGLDFPRGAFLYDLVYNPAETKLMRQAGQAGCRSSNGLGMLVHQGALAFELWTGHAPDVEKMASAQGR